MIFNEIIFYLVFLLPSVALFHAADQTFRPWIIALFGMIFFGYFGYIHFGGKWGALALLIFVWELIVSRLYRPGSKWCLFGVAQAVLILAAFKYLTFFSHAWDDALVLLSLPPMGPIPRVMLPLGISFFTFEFIHFAVDRYQGKIERATLADYAAFIFFFPTMVAGPIKRYQEFVPKLHAARLDPGLVSRGITRILVGLAKKTVLADTFSLWSDKLNTSALLNASGPQVLGWIFAYGMKIYFDFSGYSDIAIGCSYLFGIEVPENFRWPYLSRNISEFWRRWHISLGRWIFDYVYVPLGGSRRGEARTALNLLTAFAISGLWHGAAYNFVIWGLWHGVMMVVHRAWTRFSETTGVRIPAPLGIALTFTGVTLGWGLFAMDISRVGVALGRIARR
ncbi:MAG: poly(beta-D-mannuronate) O-acetylase [Planctomycetota bacterium]|nr:poly(beta-D-mannuronate) O-acetylase [Planctomycetota bacterium]